MTCHPDILQELLVYRNILEDDLVKKVILPDASNKVFTYKLAYEFIKRAENLGLDGNLLHNYLIYLISNDENIFSITAEKNAGFIGSSLAEAVVKDIKIIKYFLQQGHSSLFEIDILTSYSPTTRRMSGDFQKLKTMFLDEEKLHSPEQVLNQLKMYYIQHGYGNIAGYAFFRWDEHNELVGVRHADTVTLDDIVGYEQQKHILITNMQAFLSNKPCHNVLLVGARGTGKSSSVKALVHEYYRGGLRLVEVPKHSLNDIPTIMETLRKYGKKFILFLDDLSFEETETEYKYLKSVLEGGVELKPDNVIFCATSNRRHIIRESWQERTGHTDDVHRLDSVHEKLSLSDRFGITLTYPVPSQEEYIRIVEGIAQKNNLSLSPSRLKSEALQWEMLHSGRSGRTAQQLITHLLSSDTK